MTLEHFEDIKAWQLARELTKDVYRMTKNHKFSRDFGLRDQIQRASTSIMANIAEGFDSKTKPEFIQFLHYAKRSASEVQSHLYTALDQNYLTQSEFDRTYAKAAQAKNMIGGFIRYLLGKSLTVAL